MSGMPTGPYQDWAKQKLGFEYKDIQLLITALTHRSYVNEHRKSVSEHNERLEFLGDAVLELVVTDYLFKNYDEPEGILTSWRAALVNTISNAESAKKAGLRAVGAYESRRKARFGAGAAADFGERLRGGDRLDLSGARLRRCGGVHRKAHYQQAKSYFGERFVARPQESSARNQPAGRRRDAGVSRDCRRRSRPRQGFHAWRLHRRQVNGQGYRSEQTSRPARSSARRSGSLQSAGREINLGRIIDISAATR